MADPSDRRARGLGAVNRARATRTRRRWIIVVTTTISIACTAGIVLMFARPGASGQAGPPSASGAAAPPAPRDPPIVAVRGGVVLLDGVEVAQTDSIVKSGRMQKVDGLFDALRMVRMDRDPVAPPVARAVILDIDADTPAVVVKSVFQTAAFAGFTDVRFAGLDAGPAEAGDRGPLVSPP